MRKVFFTCLLFAASCQLILGQQSGSASVTSPDSSRIDTNYVKYYKDKLIIGLWQSERRFDIILDQKLDRFKNGSAINYIANSNHVSGVSLDYDVIGLAFGYRSLPSGDERTGNSHYLDLGVNVNTRRLRLENSFRRYTGFYDNNSSNYIHPFTPTTPYFQDPDLNLRVVKTKLIYSFNKRKFALGAAYANAKRQVKSKGSWLLVGNFYSMNLFSASSIIPSPLQKEYGVPWSGLDRVNVYACSAGLGGTYTLVFWKRFYFNFLATLGLERQFRYYYTIPENSRTSSGKTQSAGDLRTSIGYNGKRFFIRGSAINDINHFGSAELRFDMKFVSGSFDLGYRFNFRTPKPYQKFQETRLYKMM